MLGAKTRPLATKTVSLGLGSLSERTKDQPRRFKQLAVFTAIADAKSDEDRSVAVLKWFIVSILFAPARSLAVHTTTGR